MTLSHACDGEEGPSSQEGGPLPCLTERASYHGPRDYTYSVDWSPIDDYVLAGTNVELRLFAVGAAAYELRLAAVLGDRPRAAVAKWSPDGLYAVSVGIDVSLLSISRGPAPAIVELDTFTEHRGSVHVVRWSPDGNHVLTGGEDGAVRLFAVDRSEGKLIQVATSRGHVGKVLGVAWSPDGRHAISVGADASVRLLAVELDADTPQLREEAVRRQDGFDQESAVSWPARGYPLITGTWNRHLVKVWSADGDAATLDLETEYSDYHSSGLDVLEWNHDEQWIVTGAHDDTIRLSRFEDGELVSVATLDDHVTGVHSVSWAHDDLQLVLASSLLDRVALVEIASCAEPPLDR